MFLDFSRPRQLAAGKAGERRRGRQPRSPGAARVRYPGSALHSPPALALQAERPTRRPLAAREPANIPSTRRVLTITIRPPEPGERLPLPRLILRPFGYLAIAAIWTALWLIIVALAAALPVALSDRRPFGLADTPLSAASGIVDLQANPIQLIAIVVLLGPMLAVIFGWAVALLPLAAWPLAGLSFVYAARSLRPSYAGEALSGTSSTDEAIGPPTASRTALSLLPMRHSRLTDLLTQTYRLGWTPSFAMIGSCFWLGLGYLLATVSFAWPVRNPAMAAIYGVLTLGLAGYTVFRLVGFARAIGGTGGAGPLTTTPIRT